MLNRYSNKPIAHITGGNPDCWRYLRFSCDPERVQAMHPILMTSYWSAKRCCAFPHRRVAQKGCGLPGIPCTEVHRIWMAAEVCSLTFLLSHSLSMCAAMLPFYPIKSTGWSNAILQIVEFCASNTYWLKHGNYVPEKENKPNCNCIFCNFQTVLPCSPGCRRQGWSWTWNCHSVSAFPLWGTQARATMPTLLLPYS